MCGRVVLDFTLEMIREMLLDEFDIGETNLSPETYVPTYNLAPGQQLLTVIEAKGKKRAGMLTWGFIPHWSTGNKGKPLINARGETLADKPSFRDAFKRKRCIVLADSFYEWSHKDGNKQPYRIQNTDRPYMPMAGLWSTWRDGQGSPHYTCAIITTAANSLVGEIHHRMPVILPRDQMATWLSPNTSQEKLKALLQAYPSELMTKYPVSSAVNNVRNNYPDLLNQA